MAGNESEKEGESVFNHILKSSGVVIVSLTVGLYILEFLLGFYFVKSILRCPVPPGARQTHTTVDYSVQYRYNNISLRGKAYDPDQLYDLALLGDSFLFGQGVDEESTLQGVLEKRGVRVLNISEIATNPIDYHHKLKMLSDMRMKTKNIAVGLCMGNDFQGIGDKRIDGALSYAYRKNFLDYGPAAFLKLERLRYRIGSLTARMMEKTGKMFDGQYREEIVVHAFERRRVFYEDWLQFFTGNRKEMMSAMRGGGRTFGDSERLTEEAYLRKIQMDDASLENTLRILRAIARAARPAKAYLLLIPDPYRIATGFHSKQYESYTRRLVDGLQGSMGIIDLQEALSSADHFPHDGHWNAGGHKTAADIIEKRVLLQGR